MEKFHLHLGVEKMCNIIINTVKLLHATQKPSDNHDLFPQSSHYAPKEKAEEVRDGKKITRHNGTIKKASLIQLSFRSR